MLQDFSLRRAPLPWLRALASLQRLRARPRVPACDFKASSTIRNSRKHRPRLPSWSRNACKSLHSMTVDSRSVLGTAVGNGPLTVDHPKQPRESPANCYTNGDVGGVVGIFTHILIVVNVKLALVIPTRRPGCPQSRCKRPCKPMKSFSTTQRANGES